METWDLKYYVIGKTNSIPVIQPFRNPAIFGLVVMEMAGLTQLYVLDLKRLFELLLNIYISYILSKFVNLGQTWQYILRLRVERNFYQWTVFIDTFLTKLLFHGLSWPTMTDSSLFWVTNAIEETGQRHRTNVIQTLLITEHNSLISVYWTLLHVNESLNIRRSELFQLACPRPRSMTPTKIVVKEKIRGALLMVGSTPPDFNHLYK